MKKITLEEHWGNPEVSAIKDQFLAKTGLTASINPANTPSVGPKIGDFEKYRIPHMDEAGVTMQILSGGSPGIQGIADKETAIRVAKKFNDAQAEIIQKYPDRFGGFASLPLQDPKAAADELERAVTQLGFYGALIQGHTYFEYLDEQNFWVVWERAEGLGVPLYLHIQEPSREARVIYEGHPELLGPIWSWGVEAATHALRIVGAGVFDAFPKAIVILGHLGESLPYLLGRLDEGYVMSNKAKKLERPFSQYIKDNFLVTTSGKYQPEALVCAVSAMGSDRVLFAGDYPWVLPHEAVELVEGAPLSDSVKEKIYHLNAERWLRIRE
jgi:2,3-dihydroxybenzoate decarboxylase